MVRTGHSLVQWLWTWLECPGAALCMFMGLGSESTFPHQNKRPSRYASASTQLAQTLKLSAGPGILAPDDAWARIGPGHGGV